MTHRLTIDGTRFSTLEGFYDEMDRLLTRDLSWKTGQNMDAFHDLLWGGFGVHEPGESIEFTWTHANKSRRDLGYEATAAHWQGILERCHPTDRGAAAQKPERAQNGVGKTLFEMLVDEILDKRDGYDHTLILEEDLSFEP